MKNQTDGPGGISTSYGKDARRERKQKAPVSLFASNPSQGLHKPPVLWEIDTMTFSDYKNLRIHHKLY